MSAYRVVQWATGNIGARSLRGVIEHPDMTLAGLYVYAPDKVGRDAAELGGRSGPTGVLATNSIDEILALEADCVLYMPQACNIDEVCRLISRRHARGRHAAAVGGVRILLLPRGASGPRE